MNSKSSKSVFVALAFALVVISFSSCNRGYGCPYELKTFVPSITKVIK